jgi:hypothetical protein
MFIQIQLTHIKTLTTLQVVETFDQHQEIQQSLQILVQQALQ